MLVGDFRPAIGAVRAGASFKDPIVSKDTVFVLGGANRDKGLKRLVSGGTDVARQARRSEAGSEGAKSCLKAALMEIGYVIRDVINRLLGKATTLAPAPPRVARESGVYDAPWDTLPSSNLNRLLGQLLLGAHAVSMMTPQQGIHAACADISRPPALPVRRARTQLPVSDYDRVAEQSRPLVSRSQVPWYSAVTDVPRMPTSAARQGPERPLVSAYASISIEAIAARNSQSNESICEEIAEPAQRSHVLEGYSQAFVSQAGRSAADAEPIYVEPAIAALGGAR